MIYISISTIPQRLKNLNKSVESLLKQTQKPDKIFINIPFKYKRFEEVIDEAKIPKFDKLNDDRLPYSQIITSKKSMIFLEGWCCGCLPLPKSLLQKNFNKIERNDSEYIWREYYNKKLKKEYKKIFNKNNVTILPNPLGKDKSLKGTIKTIEIKRQLEELKEYYYE